MDQRRTVRFSSCACVAGLLVLTWAGCRKDDPEFQVVSLDGRVEKVSAAPDGTGEVTVSYFSKKHQQDVVGKGTITKETEIMINGVLASLSDLREGDRVRGQVRIDGSGDDGRQIALKIMVDRPKPLGGG